MPSQPESSEARFAWLLQPIRDLTKNWDIDVASQLEDYLGELEKISISFDEGCTSMNFAEAALLIQGSACIYSKKVEYLYALVYQTLDLITKNRRNQQPSSLDEQGKDKDATFGKNQGELFLELDDIQEAKNIDLKDDDNDANEKAKLIPRTPLALLPTSEMNKRGEDVLLSHKGEIIGSRKDFKMNTCTVHHSGALLLDTSCIPMLEKSLKMLYSSTPAVSGEVVQLARCDQEDFYAGEVQNDMGGDDDFSDDGVNLEPLSPPNTDVTQPQMTPPQRELRNRNQKMREEIYADPWTGLDPYDDSKFTTKPFKKGKPFKVPISTYQVPMQPEKKRKRPKKIVSKLRPKLEPISSFLSKTLYLEIGSLPTHPLKRPVYPEFNYLFWEEYIRRQEHHRRERKYMMNKMSEEVYNDINSVAEEFADVNEFRPDDQQPFEHEDDDGSVGGPLNYSETEANENARDEVMPTDNVPWDESVVSSYEILVRKYVNKCLLEAQHYAQETDISRRVKVWENRILPILEEEESHRPYDIHVYGKEVLDSFQDDFMSFKQVATNKKPHEVCRYFLAVLLMANMQNVEIIEGRELDMDTMKLKLLDKTPAYNKISEYLAPSLQS